MERAKKSVKKSSVGEAKKPSVVTSAVRAVKGAVQKAALGVKKAAGAAAPSIDQDAFYRRVQEKAYELYVSRGCVQGDHLNDWYEAERIVKAEIRKGF